MPLEVALNRIWGFPNNRSYFGNQLISLALAFSLRGAGPAFDCLDRGKYRIAGKFVAQPRSFCGPAGGFLMMKAFAVSASIAIFFLIYWVLPNGKVPARAVLRRR